MSVNNVRPEARWLLDQFGDCLAGLIHYGSTAFGHVRRGSACDFWVIVKDLRKFHSRFNPMPCKLSDGPDSVEKRVAFNRGAPNFYSIVEGDMQMKLAVIDADTFCRLCVAPTFYVKGRMQKPVNIIAAEPRIIEAVHNARADGVQWALDLLPSRFTFDEFLHAALGLSYRTEIRPEFKKRKVQSIIDSGRELLTEIYLPLLENHKDIARDGEYYIDRRDRLAKRRARSMAMRRLAELKWSREAFRNIYQNYITHHRPVRYVIRKVIGEAEKIYKSIRGKRKDQADR